MDSNTVVYAGCLERCCRHSHIFPSFNSKTISIINFIRIKTESMENVK